ncbi:hypothetical protein DQ384_34485 [Sphaerisporangium album]|uniref:Uncharacterized protein n=1 Tax=Sphaerisporangium album TaxID=509200 RepID=A0A367F0Q4_9ACTN|nr:hypothetical protein [Sphaerisporangium album]RCG23462.1 hypothetical protein DQ384_34485 [Sphaerisporangium album]
MVRAFKERHLAVVEAILASSAGELDLLGDVISPRDAATILVDALAGITHEKETPAVPAHPPVAARGPDGPGPFQHSAPNGGP